MASSLSGVNALWAADADRTQPKSAAGAAPSTELFLKLLVAQIKNQDPLNPTDSVQFISQLAEFSGLEQLIAIRNSIEAAQSAGEAGASTASQIQDRS